MYRPLTILRPVQHRKVSLVLRSAPISIRHCSLVIDVILSIGLFDFTRERFIEADETKRITDPATVCKKYLMNCEEAMKCTLITLLLLWVLPTMFAFRQSNDGKFVVHLPRICHRAVCCVHDMGVLAALAFYIFMRELACRFCAYTLET